MWSRYVDHPAKRGKQFLCTSLHYTCQTNKLCMFRMCLSIERLRILCWWIRLLMSVSWVRASAVCVTTSRHIGKCQAVVQLVSNGRFRSVCINTSFWLNCSWSVWGSWTNHAIYNMRFICIAPIGPCDGSKQQASVRLPRTSSDLGQWTATSMFRT